MARTSIFQLEKRFDLDIEMNKLMNDYTKRLRFSFYLRGEKQYSSLLQIIDNTILQCPFIESSRTFYEYLNEYEIDQMPPNHQALYKIEFICNYILWLLYYTPTIGGPESNKTNFEIIFSQIHYIIKMMNYKLNEIQQDDLPFTPMILTKRDVDVDSVLPDVEPDIRLDLLSYLDFKNEKNLEEKSNILRRLYIDIEQKKVELDKDPNKSLYTTTKSLLNNLRHHRNNFTEEQMEINCDLAFYHYIHLIRAYNLYQNKDLIKELQQLK